MGVHEAPTATRVTGDYTNYFEGVAFADGLRLTQKIGFA
jgi:hypothetical protein